jgi:hypothetical protein
MIRLMPVDGIRARVADDRPRYWRGRKADDRRIVARRDVDVGIASAEPVAELAERTWREDVGPGDADVLLLVVLSRLLADDDVFGIS